MTFDRPMMAWVSLQHASRYLAHGLEDELRAEVELSQLEMNLLGHLTRKGAEWRMTDFVEALLLSKAGVTKLIRRMEERGLVRRRPDPEDGRATFVEVTPRGRTILGRARTVAESYVQREFLQHLDPARMEALSEALGQVLAAHGRLEGQYRFLSAGDG